MATKSSKIAVTLQPDLKQKLREYGKENQIKNFSGVILSILDEYFGSPQVSPAGSTSPDLKKILASLQALSERVSLLEADPATNTTSTPKPILKTKAAAASSSKTSKKSPDKAATKPRSTTAKAKTSSKTKSAAASKSTSSAKSSSKSAPVKKAATSRKATTTRAAKPKAQSTTRKTTVKVSKSTGKWMSTREAFDMFGDTLSWSRFSKLTPEELKDRFNLDSDLGRKVRGSRFNQWLKQGK